MSGQQQGHKSATARRCSTWWCWSGVGAPPRGLLTCRHSYRGPVTVTVTLTGGPHVNVLGLSPLTCSAIPVEGVVGGSGTAAHRLANRAKKGAGERRAPGSHPQEHGHAWANGELHAVRRQGSQIDTTTTPSTARNTTAAQGKATKRGKESKSNTPPARALPRMQRHSRPRHKSW